MRRSASAVACLALAKAGKPWFSTHFSQYYPLVNKHSYGKLPIEIDGLPIKNGDFSIANC